MVDFASRAWPWILIQGVLAVIVGVLALLMPDATILTLAIFIGVWMVLDGIGMLAHAFAGTVASSGRALLGVLGALGIVIGAVVLWNPFGTAMGLAMVVAAWFVIAGVREIAVALRIRKEIVGEWLLIASGVLAVVFGVLSFIIPSLALGAIVWVVGLGAILFGVAMIVAALSIRRLGHSDEPVAARRSA